MQIILTITLTLGFLSAYAGHGLSRGQLDEKGYDCRYESTIKMSDSNLPTGGPIRDSESVTKGILTPTSCACPGYEVKDGKCIYKAGQPKPSKQPNGTFACPAGWRHEGNITIAGEDKTKPGSCIPKKITYKCFDEAVARVSGKCDFVEYHVYPHEFIEKGLSYENCVPFDAHYSSINPKYVGNQMQEKFNKCQKSLCTGDEAFNSASSEVKKYNDPKGKMCKKTAFEKVCVQNYTCKNDVYTVICDNNIIRKDKVEGAENKCDWTGTISSNEVFDACRIIPFQVSAE